MQSTIMNRFDQLGIISKSWMALLLITFILPNLFGSNIALSSKFLLAFSPERIMELEFWRLLTYPFIESTAFSLIISLVLIFLFGSHYELRMGSKKYLIYILIIHVFAGLLATAFHWLIPFRGSDSSFIGTAIFIDALLLQIFLTDKNSNILLGFIIPINISIVIMLVLGFEILRAINGEHQNLYLMVSALFVAYVYHEWNNKKPTKKKPNLRIYH